MAKTEKINNILKHKRIIFFSLVLFGLVLLIVLIYVLTYVNNKPKPFSTDDNVKITNKSDCFDFNIEAVKIALKGDKPKIEFRADISNVTKQVKDVQIVYEVSNYWTDKGTATASGTFKDGNTLTPSTTTIYNCETTLNLDYQYPIKVMPLVKVKHPTIFVKLTYQRKMPDSMNGAGSYVDETVYYKFTYSKYCTNNTQFN